jgi:L-ascorbate metabolism protein UlaG (beta-lactamase superfamily)
MMHISVTLTANAGVCVQVGNRHIWVDALPGEKMEGFSTLSPALCRQIVREQILGTPDLYCCTHDHGDHYCPERTAMARHQWPQAAFLFPEERWGASMVTEADGVSVRFLRLPHEGAQYADVLHYGLVINCQGRNILISGDCAVASPELAAALEGLHIDVAVLAFPWLTLRKGRLFAEKYLANSKILLYHLPFEKDDRFGYRAAAARAVTQWPGAELLMEPMQTVTTIL